MKTQPKVIELVDTLLDEHTYSEIADLLNEQGIRPGGATRPGRAGARFTALRVAYLAHSYGLRSRYDRLRDRGLVTKAEAVARLNIHESTLVRWAAHGLIAGTPTTDTPTCTRSQVLACRRSIAVAGIASSIRRQPPRARRRQLRHIHQEEVQYEDSWFALPPEISSATV